MKIILFFDTETTGLPKNWKAPVSEVDNWPRMIQLSWMLCDETGKELDASAHIIAPVGFEIPAEASAVHGITTERAMREGQNLIEVLVMIDARIRTADVMVGHNVSFDRKILGAEFIRNGMEDVLHGKERVCTMYGATKFCNLPGKFGPKWPKLIELHRNLFGKDFDGAHDAGADVLACKTCYFELKRIGVLP